MLWASLSIRLRDIVAWALVARADSLGGLVELDFVTHDYGRASHELPYHAVKVVSLLVAIALRDALEHIARRAGVHLVASGDRTRSPERSVWERHA